MENYKLVMPEHLNHYGDLFGGNMLKWVDEFAWIAATLEFPSCRFVTVAMDKVEFRQPVKEGSILRFIVRRVRSGVTSLTYAVDVHPHNRLTTPVFSTTVTLVRVGPDGCKRRLPRQRPGPLMVTLATDVHK